MPLKRNVTDKIGTEPVRRGGCLNLTITRQNVGAVLTVQFYADYTEGMFNETHQLYVFTAYRLTFVDPTTSNTSFWTPLNQL